MESFARMCVNIRGTSLGYEDTEARILDLAKASGIHTDTIRRIVNQ
jgi:hypothetical protein